MDTQRLIRTARAEDLDRIVEIADSWLFANMPSELARRIGFLVSGYPRETYLRHVSVSDLFNVLEIDSRVCAFLLAYSRSHLDPDDWTSTRIAELYVDDFVVVKQVAVDREVPRIGLAVSLYEWLIERIAGRRIFAAIVLEPRNRASIRFHERFGFRLVHEFDHPDGMPRGIWATDP